MAETKTEKTSKKGWYDGLKAEFKKIIWPDRNTLIRQTTAVVIASTVLGLIIAIIDFFIKYGIDFLVNL